MNLEYTLVERIPTAKEYQELREAVGWAKIDLETAEIGLQKALFTICADIKNKIIGYGRVIGDGAIYFYIQDVIVLPEYQGKGIGKRIMNVIMDYLKNHAYHNSFIGLMAAEGVSKFYEKFDFAERPLNRPGMFIYWKKKGKN